MQDFTNYLEELLQMDANQRPQHRPNGIDAACINRQPLAMAYVPMQAFRETYEPKKALENGTLFPELNMPFKGKFVKWR